MSEARLRPVAVVPATLPLRLAQGMTREDALRIALRECLDHIEAHLPAVLAGRKAEGLHQLRVALRRLNVALTSFGAATPLYEDLRLRSKAIAAALAPARELDVFLGELFEPVVQQLGERSGFDVLRLRAQTQRERAWDAALAQLTGPAFAAFRQEVAALAERQGDPALQEAAETAARSLLAAQRKLVRKRGRELRAMVPRDCHRLRIALKKLRYAAGFTAPLFGRKSIKRYLAQVEKLQDLLGRLNDMAEVRAVLGHLTMEEAASAREHADVSFAVGLILGWHRARSERLAKKTLKHWQRFKRTEPYWV